MVQTYQHLAEQSTTEGNNVKVLDCNRNALEKVTGLSRVTSYTRRTVPEVCDGKYITAIKWA